MYTYTEKIQCPKWRIHWIGLTEIGDSRRKGDKPYKGPTDIIQSEEQRDKDLHNEQGFSNLWDSIVWHNNIHVIGVPEGEEERMQQKQIGIYDG